MFWSSKVWKVWNLELLARQMDYSKAYSCLCQLSFILETVFAAEPSRLDWARLFQIYIWNPCSYFGSLEARRLANESRHLILISRLKMMKNELWCLAAGKSWWSVVDHFLELLNCRNFTNFPSLSDGWEPKELCRPE